MTESLFMKGEIRDAMNVRKVALGSWVMRGRNSRKWEGIARLGCMRYAGHHCRQAGDGMRGIDPWSGRVGGFDRTRPYQGALVSRYCTESDMHSIDLMGIS